MHQIVLPNNLFIGKGILENIQNILSQLGYFSPFIITDTNMIDLGYLEKLLPLYDNCYSNVFFETEPEPTTTSIQKGVKYFKDKGNYDSIIALGGGSVIDSAKMISIICKNGGACRDYKFPFQVNNPHFPLIAIPTTAGTGSEATGVCVISDSETGEKMLMLGSSFMPSAAIIDFSLTLSLPKRVTADTGLDALTHAIEAYISRKSNIFSDAMALSALKLIGKNLEKVYTNGQDTKAREEVMVGATLAGIAFSNSSVGLVHGMSRPLGVLFHVPHGMSNAMLLPWVLRAIVTKETRYRFLKCYEAMGYTYVDEEEGIESFFAIIKKLTQTLEVPSLSQFGINKEHYFENIDNMSDQAIASGSPNNSPKVLSKQEISLLYKQVWL